MITGANMNTHLCCVCKFQHLNNVPIVVKTEPLKHPFDLFISYVYSGYTYNITYKYESNSWDFICTNEENHIFTKEDIKMFNAIKAKFYCINIMRAYDVFVYKSSVFKFGIKDFFVYLFKRRRIRKEFLLALRNLNTILKTIEDLKRIPPDTSKKQKVLLSWMNQKLRWFLLIDYCPKRQRFIRSVLLNSFHKPFNRKRIRYL